MTNKNKIRKAVILFAVMLVIAIFSATIASADQLTEEQVIAWIESIKSNAEWQNFLANKGDTELIKPEMLKEDKVQIAILKLLVPDDTFNLETKTKFNPVPNDLLTEKYKKVKKSEDITAAKDYEDKGAIKYAASKMPWWGWIGLVVLLVLAYFGIKRGISGNFHPWKGWKGEKQGQPSVATQPQQNAEFIVDGLDQIRKMLEVKQRLEKMNSDKVKERSKWAEESSATLAPSGGGAAGGGSRAKDPEITNIKTEIERIRMTVQEPLRNRILNKISLETEIGLNTLDPDIEKLRRMLSLYIEIERIERRSTSGRRP